MTTELLVFNGIDGASGEYLLPPMTPQDISKIAQGEKLDEKHLNELKWRQRQLTEAHLGVKEGVDPKNIAETGWGSSSPTTPTPRSGKHSANCSIIVGNRRLRNMSGTTRNMLASRLTAPRSPNWSF